MTDLLNYGVYAHLINQTLKKLMEETAVAGRTVDSDALKEDFSPKILTDYVAERIIRRLEDENLKLPQKVELCNRILALLTDGQKPEDQQELIVDPEHYLTEVRQKVQQKTVRPNSGFRSSNLFTGADSPLSLNEELRRDIKSADEIMLLVSFLRMSGVRLLLEELQNFTERPAHTLRIITTTYCGTTEAQAVKSLAALPNTTIKISYQPQLERLHAKAYIFRRNSGLSTAYIGSSNLSKSAQTDGLEWNIRVTSVENPHILRAAEYTFDRYWNLPHFETYTLTDNERLIKVLKQQRTSESHTVKSNSLQSYQLLPHQKMVLDQVKAQRTLCHNYRNLVVAATGTGKTVMCAFDYLDFKNHNPKQHRLLFVAHREEILRQSLFTFRSMLGDANFGSLWVGSNHPQDSLSYLFISVQSFNASKESIKAYCIPDFYDYIVIDEAHHMTADSYRPILEYFTPKILMGLTATPERMDGKSLLPDFGNVISAELRLPQALEQNLLTPFQYLCITDVVSLTDEALWIGGINGHYDLKKLSSKLNTQERARNVYNALVKDLADITTVKALGFCVDKEHAKSMAQIFREVYGLKAAYLTSDSSDDERKKLPEDLRTGRLNYLFVVDIFNEGVDIPEVDTVLFLRPTASLTVFLQQLGRGLRLAPGKDLLTVFDFVAQLNRNYDYASRFRTLMKNPEESVKDQVKNGFNTLPFGCSIIMEKQAREYVLSNISNAIFDKRRLIKELGLMASQGKMPTLADFLNSSGISLSLIYGGGNASDSMVKTGQLKCCSYTALKQRAGFIEIDKDPHADRFNNALKRIVQINSPRYLDFIMQFLDCNCRIDRMPKTPEFKGFATMLYYLFYDDKQAVPAAQNTDEISALTKVLGEFSGCSDLIDEMRQLIAYVRSHLTEKVMPLEHDMPVGLDLHGCYTRAEIFSLFERQTIFKKPFSQTGVYPIKELNTELFFVTLNKDARNFAPNQLYKDYLMSDTLLHWQSQNRDRHDNEGARYVNQASNGRKFLLFLRNNTKNELGNCPFYCMGFLNYQKSNGDAPMNVEWKLDEPVLPQFMIK